MESIAHNVKVPDFDDLVGDCSYWLVVLGSRETASRLATSGPNNPHGSVSRWERVLVDVGPADRVGSGA